jgi:hypothetical protein
MRRWVCIAALLAGFSADDYVRHARLRQPIPIERLLVVADTEARRRDRGRGADRADRHTDDRPGGGQTAAWWTRLTERSTT